MSSVSRGYSQPITNSLAVVTSNTYWHDKANLEGNFVPGSAVQTGSIYLVDTVSNLSTFIVNVGSGGAAGNWGQVDVKTTLKDMGKDFIVGLQGGESKLITFRLVQVADQSSTTGGSGPVGYIVSENKVTQAAGLPSGKLEVRIARQ